MLHPLHHIERDHLHPSLCFGVLRPCIPGRGQDEVAHAPQNPLPHVLLVPLVPRVLMPRQRGIEPAMKFRVRFTTMGKKRKLRNTFD